MKKNLLPIIIILIVFIIILISILLIIIKKSTPEIISPKEEIGHIDFTQVDVLTDRNEYYAVKQILNKYYNAVNYLEADIKDLDIMIDVTSEDQKQEIIEEYTMQGVKILQDIIDKEAIEQLGLKEENIAQKFKQYKNSNYKIENIYYVKKSIVTNLYYVEGLLDYEKNFKLIVKTDSYTGTFSIYPQEYIEVKQYNENSIQDEFKMDEIQYIAQNDNNEYTVNEITDKIMAQYYLYDYGEIVTHDIKKAYSLLNEKYKEERFKTYEEYEKFIQESKQNYNLLQLKSYSVNEEGNEFICKDQYNNTYIFNETSVMKYTLQLDDYTLENEQVIEKYNKASTTDKGILNIDKFFKMINMKDYESAYDVLDTNFKQNYFKTQLDFENYMKSHVFVLNKVNYKEYSVRTDEIYTYKVILTDYMQEDQSEIEFNIVMKIITGSTDFVMSFEVK